VSFANLLVLVLVLNSNRRTDKAIETQAAVDKLRLSRSLSFFQLLS